MLDRVADLHEQIQPLSGGKIFLMAELSVAAPRYHFNTKLRRPTYLPPPSEHLCNIRMLHQRQRLPFSLEAGDHFLSVHAQLNNLEGDPAADRLGLLGHINDPATALADLLEQFVATNPIPRYVGGGGIRVGVRSG